MVALLGQSCCHDGEGQGVAAVPAVLGCMQSSGHRLDTSSAHVLSQHTLLKSPSPSYLPPYLALL